MQNIKTPGTGPGARYFEVPCCLLKVGSRSGMTFSTGQVGQALIFANFFTFSDDSDDNTFVFRILNLGYSNFVI